MGYSVETRGEVDAEVEAAVKRRLGGFPPGFTRHFLKKEGLG